jgi:hypothetical protein
MSALTTHKIWYPERKEKEKKLLKETPTSDRKPKKGKKQDHLKKTSLGPLRRKGNGSTHLRQNLARAKSANHQSKVRTPQRAPPAHMQAFPKPKHTPPEPMQQCSTGMQQRAKTAHFAQGG